MNGGQGRLVVVSNRLPITIDAAEAGNCLHPSGGGLIHALMSILRESRGCWIGWIGADYNDDVARLLKNLGEQQSCSFVPVFLTTAERSCHYSGFSNEIIWPVFHGLSSRCQFDSRYWRAYQRINAKFAAAVETVLQADDFIWVHDYHLMMLAVDLRRSGVKQSMAYFHHIPFPSPDIFETLPWRGEILRGLMQFDVVGFQTIRDRRNFIACLRRFLPDVRVSGIGDTLLVRSAYQRLKVGTYPIAVDHDDFAAYASKPAGCHSNDPRQLQSTKTSM
jgi:trehalose-6-phosphate synthase